MPSEKKKIKVIPDGPYEVSENIPLNQQEFVPDNRNFSVAYKEVKKIPTHGVYHLCRCGNSHNKPFCDGSHMDCKFDGEGVTNHKKYDDIAKFIEGKQIDLLDAEELCVHARFCNTKSGTWNLTTRSDYPETKDIVVGQCDHCPSGRLTAVTKEGKRIEPELPQEISVLEDPGAKVHGPIWVKGGIEIEDTKGKTYPIRNRVTLCRCGKSKNKPFCDGEHIKTNK